MHYTSWDRSNREEPVLLHEAGPQVLGTFGAAQAVVGEQAWDLEVSAQGAQAQLADSRRFTLTGNPGRSKRLQASLDGRDFAFVLEESGNWIVEDAAGKKVAQFTTKNRGVRQAIVEFEGQATEVGLSVEEAAGLSWFARLIMDGRTRAASSASILTLVLASLVALVAIFVG
ncbi:hypothetical protein G7Y31_08585 [Corynebacterium lizhenjunii]|uniref:Uncharacterized protein n=1 Tax=Corynebacterium lizhenjunii TaxID=2709394 RepID=A0A7T0KER0_9CORY|nr:hypothetical protein [Corynebacterium lizhenjunii]QPK78604.1 hypothetical protein G7Y31_08585 [Corynebacterium lizhenjunii]